MLFRSGCGADRRLRRSAYGHLLPARGIHQQHRAVLGRDDHGRKHRGDVDALAQVRRAMARMAGRTPGNGGAVPLQGHPADGRPVRPLLGAGSRGLSSLESKNARIAIRPQNDGRPSPAAGTAFVFEYPSRCAGCLFHIGEVDIAELQGAAFALERNVARAIRTRTFVLQHAVDIDGHPVALADDLGLVPRKIWIN